MNHCHPQLRPLRRHRLGWLPVLPLALLVACYGNGGNGDRLKGEGQTLFVNSENNTGKADGSNDHPYITIQEALDAQKGGETIRLAPGTYQEVLTVNKDVHIMGETAATTVLAGDDTATLLTAADKTLKSVQVSNCTLTGGYSSQGAVIDALKLSVHFENCLFTSNATDTVVNNASVVRVKNGSLVLHRCIFLDNDSTAVSITEVNSCRITNCLLAMQTGFGLMVRGLGSSQNEDVVLTNVTISGSSEAGIHMSKFGDARLRNVIFDNNRIAIYESAYAGDPLLFYNDIQDRYRDIDSGSTIKEPALIDALTPPAVNVGTLNADPLFVDAAAGDYSLGDGSPCIDAGDPAVKDADGSRSDMGTFGGPGGAFDATFVTSLSDQWSPSSSTDRDLRALLDLDPCSAVAGRDHHCDLDLDGRPDRLQIDADGSGLVWWVERAPGQRRPAPLPGGLNDVIRSTTYDVDDDGHPDLVVEHADGLVDVHPSRTAETASLMVLAAPGDSILVSTPDRSVRRLAHARGDRPDGALLFGLGRSDEICVEIRRDGRPILLTTARAGDLVRAPDSH